MIHEAGIVPAQKVNRLRGGSSARFREVSVVKQVLSSAEWECGEGLGRNLRIERQGKFPHQRSDENRFLGEKADSVDRAFFQIGRQMEHGYSFYVRRLPDTFVGQDFLGDIFHPQRPIHKIGVFH